MIPARGLVLVKPVETEETVPGGRVILAPTAIERMTAFQMEIVAVGAPSICERPRKCDRPMHVVMDGGEHQHPTDERLVPGAWVIVKHRALVDAGHASEKLYLIGQGDVLGVFSLAG